MHKFLLKTKPLYFFITTSVIGYIISHLITRFFYYLTERFIADDNTYTNLDSLTIGKTIVLTTISPFIETILFQYVPIFVIWVAIERRFSFKNHYLAIFFSAFLFGLAHYVYSFYYFIASFIIGVYFGYIAIVSQVLREQKINMIFSVFIVHSFINLMAIIVYYL